MRAWIALSMVWSTHSFPSYLLQQIGASHCSQFLHDTNSVSSHYHNTFRAFQTIPSLLVLSSSTTIKSLHSETDETKNEGQEHVLLSSLDESIYGTAFIQRLCDLQEFKETYGHCRVPKRYAKNKTLG
jgi:hypothetical protein